MTTSDRILKVIRQLFPHYRDGMPLRQQLDDISLFSLLPKLEKEFSVEISSLEADDGSMASVESLARLIEKKQNKPKS